MLFAMLLLCGLFRVYEGSYGFFRGLVFYYLLLFMLFYCVIIAYYIYICIIYNTIIITLIFSISNSISISISITLANIISFTLANIISINGSVPLLLELGVDEQLEFLFFLVHAGKLLLGRMALVIEEFQTDLGREVNALVLPNFHNVIALPDERH